ncbi:MAG TPA: AAA family ATPase [Polyangiales bacterium]|nr:AAA family ATPase [Polyangiales bacterium]
MPAFKFDDFVFDDELVSLSRCGVPLQVDGQLLRLLDYFLRNPERVVTKDELIAEVWEGRALAHNILSVSIAKLRKVLGGPRARTIVNVYGRGYRFLRSVEIIGTVAGAAFRAKATTAAAGWFGPCVGRDAALTRLGCALERARLGRGGICAVLGEPGIGKTRVAEMLERHALEADFQVTWSGCHAFGDVPPLWPWLQVLRECKSERARELLERASNSAAVADTHALHWGTPPSADSSQTIEWFAEIASHFRAGKPWLHIVEDVHRADTASLQLLTHFAAEISHLPALILITVRDTELPRQPSTRHALDYVLGHRDCERIELTRLGLPEVETYTRKLFGESDNELPLAVFEKSGGNPFFMVELLRCWAHDRPIQASDLALMGPALDIVRQNLRRLSLVTLELLAAAAAIGTRIEIGVLAAVTGRASAEVVELLEDAIAAHVLVPLDNTCLQLRFGHDLIRSVLYEDLTIAARMRLHQRVSEVLTSLLESGHQVPTAELAHHFLSALPAGDALHAVRWAERAARAASAVGAYADACTFLRRALDALKLQPVRDPAIACNLLFGLAQCERGAGEPFASHLADSLTIAMQHRFANVLCQAGELMSNAPGIFSNDGAARVIQAALGALAAGDTQQRAAMLAHLSWTPPHCNDIARVRGLLDEADRLAPTADCPARRTVLRAALYFAGGPDDYDRALSITTEMERIPATRGSRQQAVRSLEPQLGRIVAMLQRGDLRQAERAVDVFGAAARELKHAELIWHCDRMRVVMRMNAGEYAYAKLQLIELKRRAERLQLHARRALEALDWAELQRQTSDVQSVDSKLSRLLEPRASEPPNVRALKLRSMVQLGWQDAVSISLRGLPVADLYALPMSRDYLATLGHFAVASVATESLGHAAALYELLLPYPRHCVAAVSLHLYGVVAHFLAILARALGERATALAHFEDAVREHERLDLPSQLAHTRCELATLLLEPGDLQNFSRARKLLDQARATATKLGMEPLHLSAARLLEGAPQDSHRFSRPMESPQSRR